MTTRTSDILVSIATYNEIENLPRLVAEIFRQLGAVDILVVDDHSPDGTGQWCDQAAATDPRIRCLHRPGKLGLGTATLDGMRYAMDAGYRYLINLDADFSHDPRYLPDFIREMDPDGKPPRDVVVGSRYVKGGGVKGWPFYRRWMSRAVNTYARWLLGLRVRDCSGSYRCYRVAKLRELALDTFRSRGYSVYEELLWHLRRHGARIAEVPIVFVDRRYGQTKINSAEACRAVAVILRLAVSGWTDGTTRRAPQHSAQTPAQARQAVDAEPSGNASFKTTPAETVVVTSPNRQADD